MVIRRIAHAGTQLMRHLAREEQALFDAARGALPDPDLEALGAAWARARGIALPEAAARTPMRTGSRD